MRETTRQFEAEVEALVSQRDAARRKQGEAEEAMRGAHAKCDALGAAKKVRAVKTCLLAPCCDGMSPRDGVSSRL